MQDWGAWAEAGKPVDMLNAFNHITMKVIVQTMFGKDLSDEDADTMGREMAYALDFMLQNMITQAIPKWMPVPGRKRYQEAIDKVDEFLFRIIAQRRQMENPPHDLLGMLLNLIDEETGEAMTDQQIRDEVATLFLAGYETTSLTLSWGVHHLLNHPDVVEKLQAEVSAVLGNGLPTFESLEKLTYTRMVLSEIMRAHPPAFWIPRTAVEDDVIGGFSILAGQMVAVSIYNIHHNPSIWDEPEVFNPERFNPARPEKRHPLAWMPFGAGQRMCIGRDFSLMEGMFILARLAQQYDSFLQDMSPSPASRRRSARRTAYGSNWQNVPSA
jgi:cytochrome P450